MKPEDDGSDTSVDSHSGSEDNSASIELKNVGSSKQEAARKAFKKNDSQVSRYIHDVSKQSAEPHQGEAGEYIQCIVFGGLDGIITTFAVVVAAIAGGLSYGMVLIVGFANLLGDAIGMGVGDYLSSQAEADHEEAERKREEWEIEHVPEIERDEMIQVYMQKGLPQDDAEKVVDLLFQSKAAFLDVMMVEELGIMPAEAASSPWKGALITFGAFMALGGLPMIPYLFAFDYTSPSEPSDVVFILSIIIFGIALFILGAFKGKITGKVWWKSGLMMFLNGAVTTGVSYGIGNGLESIL
mmetsp:Transcript_17047/g.23717  ORF Transcript_17047/g.23717 Transcript_17047/m.23717 type:complete len:298 (-) Transcript_17047:36-929(-)